MRINLVKKAKKLWRCQSCGMPIKPGQPYRWAKGRYTLKKIRCMNFACRFRDSDLTSSDKLSRAYEAREMIEDLSGMDMSLYATFGEGGEVEIDFDAALEAAKEIIEQAKDQAREVGEEYQDGFDNMGEGLQESETGQQSQEKADSLEQYATDLEEMLESAFGITSVTEDDFEAAITAAQEVELEL